MSTTPTAEQEAAAKELIGKAQLGGRQPTLVLFDAIAALIAERDAARAERDALVIKTKPVSHLVRLERESDPGFAAPGVPQRVMDNSGLYWSVAAPPDPATAKEND